MDIDLLSRMVGELILDHDQVGLPGLGTFVAEMMPATFSDKGFTINPPYRRLSFYPGRLEDTLLVDLYAESNQIGRDASKVYIEQYLAELKAVLEERKTVVLPGLGRLRATRENALFFVPDADLDIFPSGVGLHPVSLKSHVVEPEEPVRIDVPLPLRTDLPEPVEIPRPVQEEPTPEEPVIEEPAAEAPPAEEPAAVPQTAPARKGMPRWLLLCLIVLGAVVVVLLLFTLCARLFPGLFDSLLYSPEELRILNS